MMTETRRPLIAGNWKMNGLKASLTELAMIGQGADAMAGKADLLICPPATLLFMAASVLIPKAAVGAQDCHVEASGAHTGDLSAEMIADTGASYVIVGHSERRMNHHESDDLVRKKAEAARRAGLISIVCLGETKAERDAGKTLDVVGKQLRGSLPHSATAAGVVVAYEPVWAIGTGVTPTTDNVKQVHLFIRDNLTDRFKSEGASMRILYGGSVNPANAAEIMALPHVNGALVGGASLKAKDFLAIAAACP